MGWFEWVRWTWGRVTEAIGTGLKDLIPLPEEIEPIVEPRPATIERIEEVVAEILYAAPFIDEVVADEALRLARGVLEYEKLVNVARVRQWTTQSIYDIPPSPHYQITARGVLVGPDGRMSFVDVAFPTGEAFDYNEFVRRAASSIEDDFANSYDVGRSLMVRQWTVAIEPYIQTFVPL